MTDRELMQQALEALTAYDGTNGESKRKRVLAALRERLAQPEQEPVAWADMDVRGEDKGLSWTPGHFHKTPLYTTPPHRKPLTDKEIGEIAGETLDPWSCARAIEAAHGIKGEA